MSKEISKDPDEEFLPSSVTPSDHSRPYNPSSLKLRHTVVTQPPNIMTLFSGTIPLIKSAVQSDEGLTTNEAQDAGDHLSVSCRGS